MTAPLFPLFLRLTGRRVLLVGGGAVAAGKLHALLAAGAEVTVVAPEVRQEILDTGVPVARRPFAATDLDGAWLVVAAGPPVVNAEVARAAAPRQLWVNAVDDPYHASAYTGGVLRKGGVTFAISTEGAAPALAGLLREGLEALLPDDLERWVRAAVRLKRRQRRQRVPMALRRPQLLEVLDELYRTRRERSAPVAAERRTADAPLAVRDIAELPRSQPVEASSAPYGRLVDLAPPRPGRDR